MGQVLRHSPAEKIQLDSLMTGQKTQWFEKSTNYFIREEHLNDFLCLTCTFLIITMNQVCRVDHTTTLLSCVELEFLRQQACPTSGKTHFAARLSRCNHSHFVFISGHPVWVCIPKYDKSKTCPIPRLFLTETSFPRTQNPFTLLSDRFTLKGWHRRRRISSLRYETNNVHTDLNWRE